MSARPQDVAAQQHWLQAAITSGSGDTEAAAWLTASATQSAAERLGVYRRSYEARLLECLRAEFPAVQHALGPQLFDRFAGDYLARHPPAGYTLARLGEFFPSFLATTRPDADEPEERRAPWADFLVELATLDLAVTEIYDGPGLEGRPLPTADAVVSLSQASLVAVKPIPSPNLRLYRFRFPVDAYVSAVRSEGSPPLPTAQTTFLAVFRSAFRVRFHRLFELQLKLLTELDGKMSLGQALTALTEPVDPAVLRGWFHAWIEEGLFARFEFAP